MIFSFRVARQLIRPPSSIQFAYLKTAAIHSRAKAPSFFYSLLNQRGNHRYCRHSSVADQGRWSSGSDVPDVKI